MEVPRTGSMASTKAMARAAVEGRLVTFRFDKDSAVSGYLIGMDDFHWVIVETTTQPKTNLVHKSTRHVVIGEPSLNSESEEFQAQVRKMGTPFWQFCEKTYLGRNGER